MPFMPLAPLMQRSPFMQRKPSLETLLAQVAFLEAELARTEADTKRILKNREARVRRMERRTDNPNR